MPPRAEPPEDPSSSSGGPILPLVPAAVPVPKSAVEEPDDVLDKTAEYDAPPTEKAGPDKTMEYDDQPSGEEAVTWIQEVLRSEENTEQVTNWLGKGRRSPQ